MIASRSQSYSGHFSMRQQQQNAARQPNSPQPGTPDKLMTDRSSYISYLESQLERVSAACLTVSSYDERIETLTSAVRLLEEKVLNVARLLNCTQQYAEQQEQFHTHSLQEMHKKLVALEARLEESAEPQKLLKQDLDALRHSTAEKAKELAGSISQQQCNQLEMMQQFIDERCAKTRGDLVQQASEASGRVSEVERKLHDMHMRMQQTGSQQQVSSLATRVSSVENSLGIVTKTSATLSQALAAVEQGLGQLRTAVVALELRPPVEGGASVQGTLQWLERAREALKGEIQHVVNQSQDMAQTLHSAQRAAQEPPQSPQKAVASQVLSGMQSALHGEVGRDMQALQLADSFLASVASQLVHPNHSLHGRGSALALPTSDPAHMHAMQPAFPGAVSSAPAADIPAAQQLVEAGQAPSAGALQAALPAPALTAHVAVGLPAATSAAQPPQAPSAPAPHVVHPAAVPWRIPAIHGSAQEAACAAAAAAAMAGTAQPMQACNSTAALAGDGYARPGEALVGPCPTFAAPAGVAASRGLPGQPAGEASPGHTVLRVCLPEGQQPHQPLHQHSYPAALAASMPCSSSHSGASLHHMPLQQHVSGGNAAAGWGGAGGGSCPSVGAEDDIPGPQGSLARMQEQLHAVCGMLQEESGAAGEASHAAPHAAVSSKHLQGAATLASPAVGNPPRKAWVPSVASSSGMSRGPGVAARNPSAKSAYTGAHSVSAEAALAQKTVQDRRKRLQQLYAELRS